MTPPPEADKILDLPFVDPKDPETLRTALLSYMVRVVGKDPGYADEYDWFQALAYLVRGRLIVRQMNTLRNYHALKTKRIYYLSMEFLPGRTLKENLYSLGMYDVAAEVLTQLGHNIEEVAEHEDDAALGNGGLGRLAACLMESMASQGFAGYGYGIRYEYGLFRQGLEHGRQVEHPDNWLRHGNPWELERAGITYTVRLHGRVVHYKDQNGVERNHWVDADEIMAMAYDVPQAGYHNNVVNNLRLWSSRASHAFDLRQFDMGNYVDAVRDKAESETLSKVLYPNDSTALGRELRLKQEYFFVSASLQDILVRFLKDDDDFDKLHLKVGIQLNDTHPAIAVAELMRLLIDEHGMEWARAWEITQRVFAYTNHTLLPEALETWPVEMMERILPRHMQIIYRINHDFLEHVRHRFPGDDDLIRRVSLIDESHGRNVRMAYLAVVGSHKVNGVAALHSDLLKQNLFADFEKIFPDRIVNKTNGITPRRWLNQCNPGLTRLIRDQVKGDFVRDLSLLSELAPAAEDPGFRASFREVKKANKERLADYIQRQTGIIVDPTSMFDVQVKRLHEYKRQLLNLLHVITLYNRARHGQLGNVPPRTVVFAGKAAPGYAMAKKIIHLINSVADIVNNDPAIDGLLKVVFLPNYRVSQAEVIFPGGELSEQISTAGTEASGTGNMKQSLNGSLTIGTRDGANIEIGQAVGEENIFFFGLTPEEANAIRVHGAPYDPWQYYNGNGELREALDMIRDGFFSADDHDRFRPIFDALTLGGDPFLLLADYESYIACQAKVSELYTQPDAWDRKAILNVAHMGGFSSDRTVRDYADEIWEVRPIDPPPLENGGHQAGTKKARK